MSLEEKIADLLLVEQEEFELLHTATRLGASKEVINILTWRLANVRNDLAMTVEKVR